ncbi:MAG: hypothetical protein WC373_04775 [Smithella sp.]|jgi:hypothetical protein
MSPATALTGTAWWTVNAFFAITLGVVSWNVNREFERNDDQEKRIQAIERVCVKVDYMSDDVKDIKADLKKVLQGQP